MSIATLSESTSPPDRQPLATACHIKTVKVVCVDPPNAAEPKHLFLVTISDGKDDFTAEIEAKELVTYAAFRQALLARYACWFSHESYEGRLAKQNWSGDIAFLMQRNVH